MGCRRGTGHRRIFSHCRRHRPIISLQRNGNEGDMSWEGVSGEAENLSMERSALRPLKEDVC
jgi:hypothetical protein